MTLFESLWLTVKICVFGAILVAATGVVVVGTFYLIGEWAFLPLIFLAVWALVYCITNG